MDSQFNKSRLPLFVGHKKEFGTLEPIYQIRQGKADSPLLLTENDVQFALSTQKDRWVNEGIVAYAQAPDGTFGIVPSVKLETSPLNGDELSNPENETTTIVEPTSVKDTLLTGITPNMKTLPGDTIINNNTNNDVNLNRMDGAGLPSKGEDCGCTELDLTGNQPLSDQLAKEINISDEPSTLEESLTVINN